MRQRKPQDSNGQGMDFPAVQCTFGRNRADPAHRQPDTLAQFMPSPQGDGGGAQDSSHRIVKRSRWPTPGPQQFQVAIAVDSTRVIGTRADLDKLGGGRGFGSLIGDVRQGRQ